MAKNLKHTNAEVPVYLFKQGKNFESQKFFGAHFETRGVQQGVVFRVWAPRAKAVSVVGDFNSWVPGAAPMENLDEDGGIWECFVPGLAVGVLAGGRYDHQGRPLRLSHGNAPGKLL